jgi:potassium efflux system protein
VIIWAEVFPALGIFESVELWHQTGVIDGREAIVPVTLADLAYALLILVVGWVAVRRIPSLLEILLRQRLHVSPASAYAATRIFQYALVTMLVVAVMGSLGGSWSQIQWAVAALSVGIGFGLQEIVANFISGLIILFEQPIRVGDVVTVGEVSGTVTKIRMRATTIRDWDRRELLVPNKEFITSRLLNWSLSDAVTRCSLQVGVAYGTDMKMALGIIRQVCREHPLILEDPQPLITFDEFGDNSLVITVRFYLGDLDNRLSAWRSTSISTKKASLWRSRNATFTWMRVNRYRCGWCRMTRHPPPEQVFSSAQTVPRATPSSPVSHWTGDAVAG